MKKFSSINLESMKNIILRSIDIYLTRVMSTPVRASIPNDPMFQDAKGNSNFRTKPQGLFNGDKTTRYNINQMLSNDSQIEPMHLTGGNMT